MNKKYIAIVLATLTLTMSFAACTKKYEDERIVVDREDNTHILATDKEGNTIQDEDGRIIEVVTDEKGKEVTDENGNQVTQPVTYPDILEAYGYIEDEYVKIKPEEGWEQRGAQTITMDYEKYGAQYVLDIRENKSVEDIVGSYKSMVDAMKKTATYKEADMTEKEVKVGGIKMTKLTITYTIDKKYLEEGDPESQIMYIYLHTKGEKTYDFVCTILPEHEGKIDFDKIIASIEYK